MKGSVSSGSWGVESVSVLVAMMLRGTAIRKLLAGKAAQHTAVIQPGKLHSWAFSQRKENVHTGSCTRKFVLALSTVAPD